MARVWENATNFQTIRLFDFVYYLDVKFLTLISCSNGLRHTFLPCCQWDPLRLNTLRILQLFANGALNFKVNN